MQQSPGPGGRLVLDAEVYFGCIWFHLEISQSPSPRKDAIEGPQHCGQVGKGLGAPRSHRDLNLALEMGVCRGRMQRSPRGREDRPEQGWGMGQGDEHPRR